MTFYRNRKRSLRFNEPF